MAAESSPQPLAVGERMQNNTTTIPNKKENTTIHNNQLSYAASLVQTKTSIFLNQTKLKQFDVIHGVPTVQFTKEERLEFAKEEGLHQAIVVKLSSNLLELSTLRNLLPKILGIKGQALIGQLAPRQILIRMDQFDDFVASLARSVLHFNHNGREHQIRVFPWSIDFSVMEETTKAVVWISMPNLPPELFAKKALLSIASAAGMPISIDKATQIKSRPSVARVKVILDLMDKLPAKVALQFVDNQTGKINVFCQELVYDNLPLYCYHCKHQGHDENTCRKLNGKVVDDIQEGENNITQEEEKTVMKNAVEIEKLQGDARDFLNAKKQQRTMVEIETKAGDGEDQTVVKAAGHVGRMNNEQTVDAARNGVQIQQFAAQIMAPIVDISKMINQQDNIGNIKQHAHGIVDSFEQIKEVGHIDLLNLQQEATGNEQNNIVNVGSFGQKGNSEKQTKEVDGSHVGRDNQQHAHILAHVVGSTKDNNNHSTFQQGRHVGPIGSLNNQQLCKKMEHFRDISTTKDGSKFQIEKEKQAGHRATGKNHKGKNKSVQMPHACNDEGTGQTIIAGVSKNFVDFSAVKTKYANNFYLEEKDETKAGQHGQNAGQEFQQLLAGQEIHKFDNMVLRNTSHDRKEKKENVQTIGTHERAVTDVHKERQNDGDCGATETVQAHSSNAHTLHFSNPNVERIIKDAQHEMMMKESIVKQPLVALNTSVYEIPSNSVESYGDYGGESGQLMISTGNEMHEGEHESALEDIESNEEEWEDEHDDKADFGVNIVEQFNCANLKREQENRLKQRFQFASHRVERVIKDEIQISFFENSTKGKLKNKLEAPDFIPNKLPCRTCLHFIDTPPNTVEDHIGTSQAGAIWMKIATMSDKKPIVRRPPMRAAKQKQAVPTSSRRSYRSRKN